MSIICERRYCANTLILRHYFFNAPYNVLHVYYVRSSAVALFIFTLQYLLYVYIYVYFTLDLFEVEFIYLCFTFACDKVFL